VSAPLILKHDETTTNSPGLEQLVLGELAINSATGKLYTRVRPLGSAADGSEDIIFEIVGQPVCFTKMPIISFEIPERFCCSGDMIKVKVIDLIEENNYRFELEDISYNGTTITVNDPIYTPYTNTLANGATIYYKEAIIPITVKIDGGKPWTIFKFKILGKNNDLNAELTSKTITISCES
jgi:hypothetical protein